MMYNEPNLSGVRKHLARVRYQRIKALPLAPVPNDEFQRTTAAQETVLLGPAPARPQSPQRVQPAADLPPYLASLYEASLLTREQEVHLFRKMNYLKYKASKLFARLDPERPDNESLDQIEQLYQQAIAVKNEIIQANLRLVVAMTKRYARSREPLFELVSDGNISLMRAVEKFDYARGARFSTYATSAIIKNFSNFISREYRDHIRFRNASEEVFQTVPDQRTNQQAEEAAQVQREDEVAQLLEQLDDRERRIIRYRYGLDSDREPMTLKEVGHVMGVSKERIRQLATFAPEEPYERQGDVNGVVFPCGWILDQASGSIRIYYGGADACVALATAQLSDLLSYLQACPEPSARQGKDVSLSA